jgi:hypothetical protein
MFGSGGDGPKIVEFFVSTFFGADLHNFNFILFVASRISK